MIMSRTPFRVSFAGGGSDLRAYYSGHPGAVLSTAINKYMYVTVNTRFEPTIRVSYTRTEIVDEIDSIQHDLVREGMRFAGVRRGVELTTIADVPAGTGLGSSSSLTVGLLHALYAYRGRYSSAETLADEAFHVEAEILGRPIGKQDQYAAAYGGLNYIEFHSDETVSVHPIVCLAETRRELQARTLMFYLGTRGDNSAILARQRRDTMESGEARHILGEMVHVARSMREALQRNDPDRFGSLLHDGWVLKKRLNVSVSSGAIDDLYSTARAAGAMGGKVLGAGGSGFLLLFCSAAAQTRVRARMEESGLREFPIRFESEGSRIVFIGAGDWQPVDAQAAYALAS